MVERRGKEVHRGADTKEVDGRGGEGSGGEVGSMEDDRGLYRQR